jgi:anti-sigma B factor antagonist
MNYLAAAVAGHELRHWSPGGARCQVVAARGELDLNAAPELRKLLCRLISLGMTELVLDLTDATFVDSTTLGVLTSRCEALRDNGGALVLVCTNDLILRTIEISGMDRMLDVYATLPEALARVAGR